MTIKSAEEYDPFLKRNVYGNVLDQVENFQYNAKLYMIPPVTSASGSASTTPPQSGTSARTNDPGTSSTASDNRGGYLHDAMTADPSQTVVLAQTGVTGVQIDNIEITSAVGPGNSFAFSTINFDIVQPGAADFLDQIIAARAYLGDQIFSNDVPLFLEIVFKGYSEDLDEADAGGKPIAAAGPYRFRMVINTVSLEINDEGSVYQFSCVAMDHTGYADHHFRIPKKMESVGTTIPEHVENLVKKINDHVKENYDAYQVQDEYNIDISGLSSGPYGLSDLSLVTDSDVRAEEINRIMNPELEDKEESEYKDLLESATKDEGPVDIIVAENRVTVREGVTIERYIQTLLSMNDEYYTRITRSQNISDSSNTEVNKEQAFVNWVRVNTGVSYTTYDTKRNAYAKKITFKPVIYATAKTTVGASADENTNLSRDEIQTRVDQIDIFKAYHYLFTGLNDQILNCKIDYKAAHAMLLPPTGGFSGDFSTVMAKTISSQASVTDDLTSEDLATQAVEATNRDAVSDIVDNARPDQISELGKQLGFSAADIRDAATNRNSQSAETLKSVLANRSSAQALSNAAKNTQSDAFSNQDGTDYSPTLSGYVYAGDIIGSVSERVGTAVGVEQARNTARALNNSDGDTEDNGTPEPAIQTGGIPNQAEDGTYNGTPRNTIFGYLMQQHSATDFLVTLDMEIKGDPYWLGKTDVGKVTPHASGAEDTENKSNEEHLHLAGNDNYILFDIQTPKRYDFDVADEDSNSGYWTQDGTAYFITGIYMCRRVVNIFSGGQFSQELNLIKETSLQLNKLGKLERSEEEDTE